MDSSPGSGAAIPVGSFERADSLRERSVQLVEGLCQRFVQARPFVAINRIRAVEVNDDPGELPFGKLFPFQGASKVGLELGAILFKKMEVRLAIYSARVKSCAKSFFEADDNISKVNLALPDGLGRPWLWLR
ncbi:MAG: hypothetical protein OXI01_19220 [Albidovulum sp.]|nr:hypothetical protein [Albidovulum sp.]